MVVESAAKEMRPHFRDMISRSYAAEAIRKLKS